MCVGPPGHHELPGRHPPPGHSPAQPVAVQGEGDHHQPAAAGDGLSLPGCQEGGVSLPGGTLAQPCGPLTSFSN